MTQAQWKAVVGRNPASFNGHDRPVEKVNWHDVREFIEKLNRRTEKQFRLPTKAEWEYAARAGTMTARYWAEVIDKNHAN